MESILLVLAGFIAGAIITWLAAKAILGASHGREILESSRQQADLREQLAILNSRIEADRESLRIAQEAMMEKFSAAASAALGQNNKQFLDLAKTQFEAHKTAAENDLEQRRKSIGEMLTPIREAIDGYKLKVEELGTSSNITFGQVKEMLTSLQAASSGLQKETGALVNALRNPQSRGRWGEIGLRNLVEHAGMLAYCDFAEQVYKEGEEASIRPDMVINLPDNKHVAVDSKVPLKAYMDAIDTRDEPVRDRLLAEHARAVKDRINDLSRKQYHAQFPESPDLVVLFMPIESALNAALTTDKDLLQHAIERKIILATPTTLLVVLRSFSLVWQQHNMTRNAMDIMETARELHARLIKFSDHLSKVGKGLKSALDGYNEAVGSFEGRILVTGRKLEELDARSQKENLKNIGPVDGSIRSVSPQDS